MNPDQAKQLREPFPEAKIGKLPRKDKRTGREFTLDYVGHAAVTDRLLEVDPEWVWEPLAFNDAGLPRIDQFGGLWIRLTVCGVTRLGYGEAGEKDPSGQTVKELISDAIRNAAMRFGVALDLWSKEDLHADDTPAAPARPGHAVDGARDGMGLPQHNQSAKPASTAQLKLLEDKLGAKGYDSLFEFVQSGDAAQIVGHAIDLPTLTSRDASKLIDALIKAQSTEKDAQWERINTRRASGQSLFTAPPEDDPWAGDPLA